MITDCPLSLISSNASVTFLPFVLKALQRQGFNFTYGKLMLLYLLTKSSCVLITFICQGHWSNCLFIIFIELFKLFCYIFITQRTASMLSFTVENDGDDKERIMMSLVCTFPDRVFTEKDQVCSLNLKLQTIIFRYFPRKNNFKHVSSSLDIWNFIKTGISCLHLEGHTWVMFKKIIIFATWWERRGRNWYGLCL